MGRKRKVQNEMQTDNATPTTTGGEAVAEMPAPEVRMQRPTFIKDPVCPRCGCGQSAVMSTQGRIQYRKCSAAACRNNFKSTAIF